MVPQYTRSLLDILSSTLQRLEENSDLRHDDPAVIELKKHIVRAIAELEIMKSIHAEEAQHAAELAESERIAVVPEPTPEAVAKEAEIAEPATSAPAASAEPLSVDGNSRVQSS